MKYNDYCSRQQIHIKNLFFLQKQTDNWRPAAQQKQEQDKHIYLTLKWPKYFYFRWCQTGGGGILGPKSTKPLSQRNFAMKFAPYMYVL